MKYLLEEATVFAVGSSYDIVFNTEEKGLAWVEIDGKRYYDTDNGNIKSEECVHKIEIPMSLLDKTKEYKIGFRRAFERKQYFPTSEEEEYTKEYKFYPVEKKEAYNIYMLADTHSNYECSSKTAQYFGDDLDFLILNGDIADGSIDTDHILTTHKIASMVSKGEKPVVFVRGNHDTRGAMACELSKYIPVQNGKTYCTFTLGDIFGICLDCGEDKTDDHAEYGHMADFEQFRRDEIGFIDEIIEKGEYLNYSNVLVICHIRISKEQNAVFSDVYNQWLEKLNEISPDLMLCGHEHVCYFLENDRASFDDETKRTNYPVVVGAEGKPDAYNVTDFIGSAVLVNRDEITVKFTNSNYEVTEEHTVKRF
ncbi:MAG: metallophosphoesterase [Clostridia bacterium]|nr:metallophosphoesterase [Clostridia bacterium]